MKKNEDIEVLTGEIVDDPKEMSKALAASGTDIEKKEKKMEKTEKWIDMIALIGGGILKLISSFSKSNPSDTNGNSGNNDPSPGRRRRKHGRHS